ncbi:hypothetical protein SMALB_4167 [Streptomyces malaysiensis]|uniref:Uncharacterized protein n=1 Tax=Streptomyces malaysiensis TaxID=92644 RepID=A0A7X5X400_STRMQ|nr:hypothetical protein [Streptomyces malaysiensis]
MRWPGIGATNTRKRPGPHPSDPAPSRLVGDRPPVTQNARPLRVPPRAPASHYPALRAAPTQRSGAKIARPLVSLHPAEGTAGHDAARSIRHRAGSGRWPVGPFGVGRAGPISASHWPLTVRGRMGDPCHRWVAAGRREGVGSEGWCPGRCRIFVAPISDQLNDLRSSAT